MTTSQSTIKQSRIFYPLVFFAFIWQYGISPFGLPMDILAIFGAWRFSLVTLAIVAVAAWFFRNDWPTILGLPTNRKQFSSCLVAAVAAFVIFFFFIDFVLSQSGHQISRSFDAMSEFFGRFPLVSWTLSRICQPLNEEIVLRALLLGFFARYFTHRAYLAILAALMFSLLHFILYYFGSLATILDLSTLLTLFFFGLAANALYLTFNHIGYGFVIHMAWNWWRFSGDIVKDGVMLNEPQGFNVIEGSGTTLVFVSVLSLVCITLLVFHDRNIGRKK
jgi:membrane protease YdiL (CAAX protease family)